MGRRKRKRELGESDEQEVKSSEPSDDMVGFYRHREGSLDLWVLGSRDGQDFKSYEMTEVNTTRTTFTCRIAINMYWGLLVTCIGAIGVT